MRLVNQFGIDLLQGVGADRSTVTPEVVAVVFASTSVHPVVHESDTLTLVVDNQHAASAEMQIELYYAHG